MGVSVSYLHNYMIKLFDNGELVSVDDYVTHKVPISDKTLRSFIPLRVCKINPKLRKIFRCDIFIIIKDMKIDSNICS